MYIHRFSDIKAALRLAVCWYLIAGFTAAAQAAAPMVKSQAPAFYRVMLGDIEVTALLDENSP